MIAAAELSSLAGRVVVASLWEGGLLISVAALGLRLAPRLSAATRFFIWTMTLCAIVALPLLTTFSVVAVPISARRAVQLSPAWGSTLAGIWCLLGLYRVIELLLGVRHLVRVAREAQPMTADPSTAALLAASARPVQLCLSSAVDAPCVAGFRSPRLLLPAGLVSSLDGADLQAIVLHEMEHLRRRDDWFNLASKLAIAVFPFNPLLVWLDRRLGLERELACDASVIATTRAPLRYAGSLTRLAEHRAARRLAFVLAAWGQHSEVVQRVSALLTPFAPTSWWRRCTAIALVSASLLATSCALLRAPQFVSFSAAGRARSDAMASDAGLHATPTSERAIVVPAAFHPQPSMVHRVLVRSQDSGFKEGVVKPFATFARMAASSPAHASRAMFTSTAARRTRISAPARRTRGTQPAVKLLRTDFPTFAAFPSGDGWLIVQL